MKKLKSILTASLLLLIAPSWAMENNVEQAQGSESAKLINQKETNLKDSQSNEGDFLLKNGLFVEKLIKGNIKKVYKRIDKDKIILKNNAEIAISYFNIFSDKKLDIYKIRIKDKYYLFKNPVVLQLIQEAYSAQDAVEQSNLLEECKECIDYLTKGK